MITCFSVGSAIEIKDFIHDVLLSIRKKIITPAFGREKVLLTAEAVEKAHPLGHFIPDFCLHQSIQKKRLTNYNLY